MDKKNKKALIWCVVTILLILGAVAPIIPTVMRKLQDKTHEDTPSTRLSMKLNYAELASQSVSLPIIWGIVNTGENVEGTGIKLLSIKRAFPHDKSIHVVLEGKAFYKDQKDLRQSDAEIRVELTVAPVQEWLSVTNVSIDAIRLFDFPEAVTNEFLQNRENIAIELEKHFSTKLVKIPIQAKRIYEMTNEQIVFFVE